jgi:peptide/nickel transport system ATP-binding protein
MTVGVTATNLTVVYDRFVAVDDVSFRVEPGESFGIVGESGSGKSTVLRALCGLAPVTGGTIGLVAAESRTLPEPGSKTFRRVVQMVFQDPYGSLHPRQTVDRILAEPLAIHRIGDAERRIEQALEEVGLGTGFRFLEPEILLLDEPTSALDASVQSEVLNLLEELRRRRGLTFLMVSHDLAVVTHMCERLMVMHRGKAVEFVASQDLAARRLQSDYTRTLMEASVGFRRGHVA